VTKRDQDISGSKSSIARSETQRESFPPSLKTSIPTALDTQVRNPKRGSLVKKLNSKMRVKAKNVNLLQKNVPIKILIMRRCGL
jgi:hypothetical protein